jgi:hypothetical protein
VDLSAHDFVSVVVVKSAVDAAAASGGSGGSMERAIDARNYYFESFALGDVFRVSDARPPW